MKIKFPTDRVVYFSDAIFAIAITLLVLEIKIPSSEDVETLGASRVLIRLIPSFIGFLISFLVTALYWRSHLQYAQFIVRFDDRLLWLNTWLLLFVVLLPFSTALYAKNFNETGPFIFYAANLVAIGLFNYAMIYRIGRPGMHTEALTSPLLQWLKFRAIVAPLVWGLSIPLAPFFPLVARFLFLLIFVIQAVGDRRYRARESQI